MELDVRSLESPKATELYITARPTGPADQLQQGRQIFSRIGDLLRQKKAWVCQERLFAPRGLIAPLREIRSHEYGSLADGVEPTFLAAEDAAGVMPGVQVHALAAADKPRVISAGSARARVFGFNGCRWITASGLSDSEAGDGPAQTRSVFVTAQRLLKAAGGDLQSLARTWIFMDDVLSWYGPFNQARSGFFKEQGLLVPGSLGRLPASTGIGVSPANGSRCAIDLMAVIGPDDSVTRHEAAGKQRSANEYGSAFARAAVAKTPAGETIYVSGTAAIDESGATCYLNDAVGQVRMTVENVRAVLGQFAADSPDVVQAMAYCANPAVRKEFLDKWAPQLGWPCLTMIADVCRDDLLFEIEVTACPGAKKLS